MSDSIVTSSRAVLFPSTIYTQTTLRTINAFIFNACKNKGAVALKHLSQTKANIIWMEGKRVSTGFRGDFHTYMYIAMVDMLILLRLTGLPCFFCFGRQGYHAYFVMIDMVAMLTLFQLRGLLCSFCYGWHGCHTYFAKVGTISSTCTLYLCKTGHEFELAY